MPRREWLAVSLPVAFSLILLASVVGPAHDSRHGWLVLLCCFAGGAAVPIAYTLVLLRSGRLFLAGRPEIDRNRVRARRARPLG